MHKKHFICIKQSGLHSLNLPKSPNSRNTCQTHLSRESGESSLNSLANVGESGESLQNSLANVGRPSQNCLANFGESGESRILLKKAILASAINRQKTASFGRVLALAKFARE